MQEKVTDAFVCAITLTRIRIGKILLYGSSIAQSTLHFDGEPVKQRSEEMSIKNEEGELKHIINNIFLDKHKDNCTQGKKWTKRNFSSLY